MFMQVATVFVTNTKIAHSLVRKCQEARTHREYVIPKRTLDDKIKCF